MLRVAAKQITVRCTRIVPLRQHSVQSSLPRPADFGKKLLGLTLVTGTAAAGTIAYAYKNPEFRQTIESYIPPTKELFNSIIGPSG